MATKTVIEETEAVLVFAKCHCCGLTEEYTQAYIDKVREKYQGNCFCGLCGEAVNDEIARSQRLITTEEAVARHINFCRESKNPAVHLVDAVRLILRRSPRSRPNSPLKLGTTRSMRLSRSESCMLTLALQSSSSSSYTDLQELMQ